MKNLLKRIAGWFIRGDANRDGRIDIADVISSLLHQFKSQPIKCQKAADIDDNGTISLSDAIRLLQFIYGQAQAPARPYPDPGVDPTNDELRCE